MAREGGGLRPRPRSRRLGRAGGQPQQPRPKLPQQLLQTLARHLRLGGAPEWRGLRGRGVPAEVSTGSRNLSRGGGNHRVPAQTGLPRGNDSGPGKLESRAERVPRGHLLGTGISPAPPWAHRTSVHVPSGTGSSFPSMAAHSSESRFMHQLSKCPHASSVPGSVLGSGDAEMHVVPALTELAMEGGRRTPITLCSEKAVQAQSGP